MRKRFIGIVAALGLIGAASQASATEVVVTYTGVVYSISDLTGIFKGAQDGDSFTSKYVIDYPTINGTLYQNTDSSGTSWRYSGGPGDPYTLNLPTISPVVSATVTINNITVNVPINQYGVLNVNEFTNGTSSEEDGVDSYQQGVGVNNAMVGANAQAYFQANGQYTIPLSFVQPLTISNGSGNQSVSFQTDYPEPNQPDLIVVNTGVSGTVSGINVSAIPEPSTWAMMLLGFAGLGFMAYRRKSKPALMTA